MNPEYEPRRMTRLNPGGSLLLGAILGVALSFLGTRSYSAEVSLYFPSMNTALFQQLTQALRVDPLETNGSGSASAPDPRILEAASSVLQSRAALEHSLAEAKVALRPGPLTPDPVDDFRRDNIEVEAVQSSTLRLAVRSRQAESARRICEGLLDYYSTFIKQNSLTRTSRVRKRLETQLADVEKRLQKLEDQLLEREPLAGGLSTRPDLDVLTELWKKRINEKGSSQLLLQTLRRLRAQSRTPESTETPDVPAEWQRKWGSPKPAEEPRRSLPGNVRREDVPSRLQLERNYEENLLIYHAALVQHSFLSTWEGLEDYDFQIVDPLAVRSYSSATWPLWMGLIGAGCGLLTALLWNQWNRDK